MRRLVGQETLAQRFWPKVDVRGPDECWPWTAARLRFGYGYVGLGAPSRQTLLAHRVAWELRVGPIPDGMQVLHHCDNPPCCNPAHLFTGTQAENLADMRRKGRAGVGWHGGKLTTEQIRTIRARAAAGEPKKKLAREFGVDPATIRYQVKGGAERVC